MAKIDTLERFELLQRELVQERAELQKRLAKLNRVLGANEPAAPLVPKAQPQASPPALGGEKLGMREAIQQATASQPLTIREVVAAIKNLGYRFKSSDPYNSVGAYLYGKAGREYFKKIGKTFAPLGRTAAAKSSGAAKPAKRKMSAAGKARISAAAKARWAAFRADKGKAKPAKRTKKKMSAAGRAVLASAAKARWAKAKAQGKTTL